MPRHLSGDGQPAVEGDIYIAWIDLQTISPPPGALGGEKRRARTEEAVENDIAAVGGVQDGVGNEADGFDRRVLRQQCIAFLAETVDPRVRPDIGAVASMSAQLDVIDVRGLQ